MKSKRLATKQLVLWSLMHRLGLSLRIPQLVTLFPTVQLRDLTYKKQAISKLYKTVSCTEA